MNLIKKSIFNLQPLDENEWTELSAQFTIKRFNKGEFLTRQGEVERNIYFLNQGITRHYFVTDGKDFTVDFQLKGDFVTAYYSLITQEPSAVFIEILEDAEVVVIPYSILNEFYTKYPKSEKIGRLIAEAQYVRRLRKEMDLLSKTAEERYAALLQRDPELVNLISVKHLASFLGIQPESLSRIRKLYARN